MIATTSKKKTIKYPKEKIYSMVQTALPRGAEFEVQLIDSKIGRMKIVRVVTPAWKKLSPADRILRIIQAANTKLSNSERKDILRFSVLTPEELELVTDKPAKSASN